MLRVLWGTACLLVGDIWLVSGVCQINVGGSVVFPGLASNADFTRHDTDLLAHSVVRVLVAHSLEDLSRSLAGRASAAPEPC